MTTRIETAESAATSSRKPYRGPRRETQLYPEIKKAIRELTQAVSKVPGSTYNQGLPDYIFNYRGVAVHMEVKLDRVGEVSWPTDLQIDHLERYAAELAVCFVLTFDAASMCWCIRRGGAYGPNNQFETADRKSLSKLLEHWIRREVLWLKKNGKRTFWESLVP